MGMSGDMGDSDDNTVDTMVPTMCYDSGLYFVPYNTIFNSWWPKHWLKASMFARSYRIKGHTVTIKKVNSTYDQISDVNRGTVSVSMLQMPLYVYRDKHKQVTMDMVESLVENEDLYDVNGRFTRCTIMNREQGQLRRCIVNLGPEYVQSMGNDYITDWENTLFPGDFNGMWEIDTLQPGQSYTYTWNYDNEGWLPLGTFTDKNYDPHEQFRNLSHDLPIGDAGHTQMNWHTGINHMHKRQAPPICLKGEKILGPTGPLKICYNFEITYEASIEFNYDKQFHTRAFNMGSWAEVLHQPKQDQWDQVRKPVDQWHNNDPKYLEIPYTMAYIQGPTNERVHPKSMSLDKRSFLDETMIKADRRLRTVNPKFGNIKMPIATKNQGEFREIKNPKLMNAPKKTVVIDGTKVTISKITDSIPTTADRDGNAARVNLVRPDLNQLQACKDGIANLLSRVEQADGSFKTDGRFDLLYDGMDNDAKEAVQKIFDTITDDSGIEFIQDTEGKPIINLSTVPIGSMDETHIPLNLDITEKGIIIGQGLTHADTCSSDQSKANRAKTIWRNPKTGRWVHPYKPGTSRAEINTYTKNPERAQLQAKTDNLNQELRKVLTDVKVKPDVMAPIPSMLQQTIEVAFTKDYRKKPRIAKTAVIDTIAKKTREEYYKDPEGNQAFDSAGAVTSALFTATKIPDYFATNSTQLGDYTAAISDIIQDNYDPSTRAVSHKRFAGPDELGFVPEKKRQKL
ncbi:hypothetical protein DPMN_045508 [Dreissena polymorpha]|uniref:Uncharacterized protein n=1 Tax=Dreissena polymorpha TaxID=45954 RepID=A0A9D4HXF3_DREPO|nr:hypothetical protein DPMN_045508 [Dreissena polymorpha]